MVVASWWTREEHVLPGVPLVKSAPAMTLYMDASLAGWGAFLTGQTASGVWTLEDSLLHINVLEMKAAILSITAFLPSLIGKEVCLATDNSTVVAYLNNQGGTKSPDLCLLARDFLLSCQKNNILMSVRHIPGRINVVADSLSRIHKPVITEWTLNMSV